MRRLPTALAALASFATVIAVLAAPAQARDGGHDSGSDDSSHSSASANASANDDEIDDATDDSASALSDDVADTDEDLVDDDAASLEFMLTGSSLGGPKIAGAAAGGRPWVIDEGQVEIEDGFLDADIEGLVIPPAGTNPVTTLSVSLVCGGVIAATTSAVPFSAAGNAMVHEAVMVPSECLMPEVLVHPGANKAVYIAFG
jgi:hypothetical protein